MGLPCTLSSAQHKLKGLCALGLSSAIDTVRIQHTYASIGIPIPTNIYRLMLDYIAIVALIRHNVDKVLVVPLPISETSVVILGNAFMSSRMIYRAPML